MQPWQTLDSIATADGLLELRRRAADDFLITIDGRVLMNSRAQASEVGLARLACRPIASRRTPRVLIGGLGMGCTLRAALTELPRDARVVVAELTPRVVDWCSGPLADVNAGALRDPRCEVRVEDVADTVVSTVATAAGKPAYDAVMFDLYEGPAASGDRLFGRRALERVRAVLRPGGVFAIWSEGVTPGFERRLELSGYAVERRRLGRGGLRHVVYLARQKAAKAGAE